MRKVNPSRYNTFIFDCDGVVLNSNKIKTQAFYEAAKHFGHDAAQSLVEYHVENGGVSRYAKFEYFIREILCQDIDQILLNDLLTRFAQSVKRRLMECDVADGLGEFRERTKHAKWLIVSGGDQGELREVFAARKLDVYFDGGIYGSPDTKDVIIRRELHKKNISMPSLFLGDSKYDYHAATQANLDFIFLSKWTEVPDWAVWVEEHELTCVSEIGSL